MMSYINAFINAQISNCNKSTYKTKGMNWTPRNIYLWKTLKIAIDESIDKCFF